MTNWISWKSIPKLIFLISLINFSNSDEFQLGSRLNPGFLEFYFVDFIKSKFFNNMKKYLFISI